ncbi:fasciclin domain-containing protein [Sphingomonas sp.]|uniref:fasciclin domain-containing protein n=1 Tax=Sphingomonas sp. TaxID=28214 RepID=UPI003CC6C765
MRVLLSVAALLVTAQLIGGCARPVEQIRVAPAAAVVGSTPRPGPVGNPLIGGVAMPVDRRVGAAVAAAPTLTTLSRAVQAAGIATLLDGPGPVTLFAPTDAAFARLAPGTIDTLLRPENRGALDKLLRLHLVAGRVTSTDLLRRIGTGDRTLTTLSGETLTLSLTGAIVTLTDAGGDKSYVETADVRLANGMLHVVNGVLVPRL